MKAWSGAASGRRRWSPLFDDMFAKIFARYPDAEDHDPCPCGLTLAVVPKSQVQPELHYAISDRDLIAEALALLAAHHRAERQQQGDDSVLIIAECA